VKYQHFGQFIADFEKNNDRLALSITPFIRTEQYTYKELMRLIYQTAHYLRDSGVRADDRIMIIAGNSPEWVQLFLGSQLLGIIVVPVDVRSSSAVAERIIQKVQPVRIFRGKYVMTELDKHPETYILDNLQKLITVHFDHRPRHPLSGHETAVIVFTSGTTAAPKGVVLTQRNILADVNRATTAINVDPNWRFLSVLPLSHMYELTGGCLVALASGSTVYYVTSITPSAITSALVSNHITTMLAIPQLLTLFMEQIYQTAKQQGKARSLAWSFQIAPYLPLKWRRLIFRPVHKRLGGHLRYVVTGGAPIPPAIARDWEKMGIFALEGYGLTETSPVLTVNRLEERRFGSAGLVLPDVQVRIAEDGEIQAKGDVVFSRYWQNPVATRGAFTSDGWFKTGDIGHLENGWLYIQGRQAFRIVLPSGLKVMPEDVEVETAKQSQLGQCCIVGVKTSAGEEVCAVIITDEPDREIESAIKLVNDRLESFQHISSWLRWPEADFPRTRLLKVDRRAVQAWANQVNRSADTGIKQETDSILRLIGLVVDRPNSRVKESDRLADMGLDSLKRLTLVSLIEEQLGVAVSEEYISQTTTLAGLRKIIKKAGPAATPQTQPSWPFILPVRFIGNAIRDSFIRYLLRIWVQLRVEGKENLNELTQPALFIFNHSDDFDGLVVYRSLPRSLRRRLTVAVGADVMQKHWPLAFLARFLYGGFSFARSEPYLPSLRYVARMLEGGWNVALAPEGKISVSGELQPFKQGIGLLAVELQVPVVVVKITGLHGTVPLHAKWPQKRSQVTVHVSRPFTFSLETGYEEVTKRLQSVMAEL
jgi:long-chain acyl-CoA synthetase